MPVGVVGTMSYLAVAAGGLTSPVHTYDPVEANRTFIGVTWATLQDMVRSWTAAWKVGRFTYNERRGMVSA